jgi:hypothetical protein
MWIFSLLCRRIINKLPQINMEKQTIRNLIFLLLSLLFVLTSCVKEYSPITDIKADANSTLEIRTRSGAGVDPGTVAYPVQIYVFNNADNSCATVASIQSAETPVVLRLLEGTYTVCAVAGADAAKYQLPTEEEATKEHVLKLKDGLQHGDLMTAQNTVTLTDGEENTLTLALKRRVMQLQEVVVNNVPSATTAVSVTITPLYEGITLAGDYAGENGSFTVDLVKQAATKTWTNTDSTYLLAAAGGATVSVKMTSESGTRSYSYACADELKANYKVRIAGTYTDKVGVSLTGTLTGEEWAGEHRIVFNFDDNGSVATEGGEEKTGEDTGGDNGGNTATAVIEGTAPQAGSAYGGAYVMRSVKNADNTVTVTLLTPKIALDSSVEFSTADQTIIKTHVDQLLPSICASGSNGWRLPVYEEMEYMKANRPTISDGLKKISGAETISLVTYLYEDNGTIYGYDLEKGSRVSVPSVIRFRAVATLTFTD